MKFLIGALSFAFQKRKSEVLKKNAIIIYKYTEYEHGYDYLFILFDKLEKFSIIYNTLEVNLKYIIFSQKNFRPKPVAYTIFSLLTNIPCISNKYAPNCSSFYIIMGRKKTYYKNNLK